MRKLLALVTIIALPLSAACTVHQTTAPSESGPAEAALSLKLVAFPDRLAQDGAESSRLSVTAFDPAGHPIAVQVHLDVQPFGFGTLSTNPDGNLATTTDTAHPTTVTYVPPASTTGNTTTVTIVASTIGVDANQGSTQRVALTVMPAAAISGAAPTAVMSLNPVATTYAVNRAIVFDGSASCGGPIVSGTCTATSPISSYRWSFGDGGTSTAATAVHSFNVGTYTVTLTVTNAAGLSASTSQSVTIVNAAAPTVSYSVSPGTIKVSAGNATTPNAFFNAAASAAASGHTIVSYLWNFGDGTTTTTTSPSASRFYGIANTYKTTLTVTDDLGQTSTGNLDVTVVP